MVHPGNQGILIVWHRKAFADVEDDRYEAIASYRFWLCCTVYTIFLILSSFPFILSFLHFLSVRRLEG